MFLLAPVDYAEIVYSIGGFLREDLGLSELHDGVVEPLGNVVLFIPVGLLLVLHMRRAWPGTLAAVAISASVEIVQLLIPSRVTSVRDIVANTIGATVGALVAWLVVRRDVSAANPGPSPGSPG